MPHVLSEVEIAAFRTKLCRVATRLFLDKGVKGVTMRELATAMGVSAMTPYRYFRDKDEILATVRTRMYTEFADALETAFSTGKGTILERAIATRDAYVRFAFDNPERYRLMFDLEQDQTAYPELDRAVKRALSNLDRFIQILVGEHLLAGQPVLIGHVFWATLHGAICLKLAGKLSSEYDIAAILDAANRALMRGFEPEK